MKNVEDIYPLSPMQEVMLLHAQVRSTEDVLLNQFCYEITGPLDAAAFRSAWDQTTGRHPALRSCFVWQNVKQPLQIVRREVDLPFEELDWRGLSAEAQRQGISELRQSDREQAFDLTKAPLQRFKLVQLGTEEYFFMWSSHHLLLDRWCLTTLYEELFSAYDAGRQGMRWNPPAVRPFRDYINWLKQQDRAEAEDFWRASLFNLGMPSLMTRPAAEAGTAVASQTLRSADRSLTASLRELAGATGLTLSVVVQGALGLLVGQRSGQSDICFGSVVNGRPHELPGVESIVGSFINNVPVSISLRGELDLHEWLRSLQAQQHRRSRFDHVSMMGIQALSSVPRDEPLFDTLLVWLSAVEMIQPEGFRIRALDGESRTAFPLTLSVFESDDDLAMQLDLKAGYELRDDPADLLDRLFDMLAAVVAAPAGATLSMFGDFLPALQAGLEPMSESGGDSCTYRAPTGRDVVQSAGLGGGREALDVSLLEETLASEWRALLANTSFGPDDDFFECGGNSLLAARLHASMEASTRLAVPVIALFRQPTIRGMAKTLKERDWPLRPGLVQPVRLTGSRPPLFCVASPDVNTLGYVQMSHHLSGDQPVFILQAPPDSDRMRRLDPDELAAVASSYLVDMRHIQPAGPYHLLGMCTGAHLAFEMGRQLEQAGQQVDFLAIINTWALFTVSRLYHLARILDRADYYRGRIMDLLARPRREQVTMLKRLIDRRLGRVPENEPVAAPGYAFSGTDTGDDGTTRAAAASGIRAAADLYDPWIEDVGWTGKRGNVEKFAGAVTVFRIRKQQFWRIRDKGLGWGMFAGRVEVQQVSGSTHNGILREPGVREVAHRVDEHLRSAYAMAQRAGG